MAQNLCTTASFVQKHKCLHIRCVGNGLFRRGTVRHCQGGSRWHGQQEVCDHVGLATVDEETVGAHALQINIVPLKDTAKNTSLTRI